MSAANLATRSGLSMAIPTTWRSGRAACSSLSIGISRRHGPHQVAQKLMSNGLPGQLWIDCCSPARFASEKSGSVRSEEHTSELQSRLHLVCRLLLEKKNKKN